MRLYFFYNEPTKSEIFNSYLKKISKIEKVGIRRKMVVLRQFIRALEEGV